MPFIKNDYLVLHHHRRGFVVLIGGQDTWRLAEDQSRLLAKKMETPVDEDTSATDNFGIASFHSNADMSGDDKGLVTPPKPFLLSSSSTQEENGSMDSSSYKGLPATGMMSWASSEVSQRHAPQRRPEVNPEAEQKLSPDHHRHKATNTVLQVLPASPFAGTSVGITGPAAAATPASAAASTTTTSMLSSASSITSMGDEYRSLAAQKARGEERLKALLASKEHARRSFPRIRRQYQDLYLKIMVAGESGHGKTTFINNMFLSYINGKDVKPHDGSRTRVEDFVRDPSALCTRFTVENVEAMERMHYTVQDTPGYGDDTDISKSIKMIMDYVDRTNEDFLKMEKDKTRMEALGAREDPRVDVCLYFIAAHRLKFIDIKFMQAISTNVSVIPIIAKADSMTAEETVQFRGFVLSECEKHHIRLFDFGEEAKTAVGIPPDLLVPPFAVVASNKFDEVRGAGSFWPVRDYYWGTCEAFSTQHSDVTYLKRLLLEEGFHDLRKATEKRYHEFRRDYYRKQEQDRKRARQRMKWSLLSGLGFLLLPLLWLVVFGSHHATDQGRGEGSLAEIDRKIGFSEMITDPVGTLLGAVKRAEVSALSSKLRKKEHQLEMAEHKIDLLVKSVRDLEEGMSRLTGFGGGSAGGSNNNGAMKGQRRGFLPGEHPHPAAVAASSSTKDEIDTILAGLGFGATGSSSNSATSGNRGHISSTASEEGEDGSCGASSSASSHATRDGSSGGEERNDSRTGNHKDRETTAGWAEESQERFVDGATKATRWFFT